MLGRVAARIDTPYGTVERVEALSRGDISSFTGHLVPMVGAIVREIDLGRRRIVIIPRRGCSISV